MNQGDLPQLDHILAAILAAGLLSKESTAAADAQRAVLMYEHCLDELRLFRRRQQAKAEKSAATGG
jgi:hypothetical protein